jgi:hypothetical protein
MKRAADKKLNLLAKSINVKAKAEKPSPVSKPRSKNRLSCLSKSLLEGSVRSTASKVIWKRNKGRNESLMVHLDAEEEHSARGRQNGWAYLRRYNPTRSLELCCSSPGWAVVPENLNRLIELLNLQWLLQNRDRADCRYCPAPVDTSTWQTYTVLGPTVPCIRVLIGRSFRSRTLFS